ncbi:MAG: hypothetical protein DI582_00380 [Azospirillum brasilense]|nr:MAG: hypothetical protein DI582_00380 [Azospirillum brasilense]
MVADVSAHPPILPVILAGGSGARLAPISTPECPKPFVAWPNGHCLYRQAIERLSRGWLPPLVIGREQDRFRLLNHVRDAGRAYGGILLEHQPFNTGFAVALAAAWLERHAAVPLTLALLPADHLIRPVAPWQQAIQHAAEVAARAGQHCLLSARPRWDETGYGYIDADWHAKPTGSAFLIRRFVEKPAQPGACIAQGMQWNTGQVLVTISVLIDLFQKYAPEYLATARRMVGHATRSYEFTMLACDAARDPGLEAVPFDRLILEKADGYVIPLDAEWGDLGTVARWQEYAGVGQGTSRTDRPWGYFEMLAHDERRVLKKLTIYPGARLSLQQHQFRDEHWQVLQGVATVQADGATHLLEIHDEISIRAGCWHRLENNGTENLIIIETQIGKCLESDILRKEDDYGRI